MVKYEALVFSSIEFDGTYLFSAHSLLYKLYSQLS